MFSKLFGAKKEKETIIDTHPDANWSFINIDMHSHLIPGIDDGASNVDESLAMIREIQAMGYQGAITTPHIKSDHYPNNPETILNGLKTLKEALAANNMNFPIRAAAEYYVDERFMEMLEAGNLLTIYNKEVLIEFSFMFEPMRLNETLFNIQTKGYRPIIAHPERYNYYHQKTEVFRELKERGCKLQLNVLSITGYYGKTVKETAEKLLKEKLYDYCGTDMHHMRHVDGMNQLRQSKYFGLLYNYPFLNKGITVQ